MFLNVCLGSSFLLSFQFSYLSFLNDCFNFIFFQVLNCRWTGLYIFAIIVNVVVDLRRYHLTPLFSLPRFILTYLHSTPLLDVSSRGPPPYYNYLDPPSHYPDLFLLLDVDGVLLYLDHECLRVTRSLHELRLQVR